MSVLNFKLFRGVKGIITGVVVVVAAIVAGWWYYSKKAAAADAFTTTKIERGLIRNSVNATGTLQAITTVLVGSQVSGTISQLHADFNSVVKKGQIVAQLDPSIFRAQLASAQANLESARAGLLDAQARVQSAESAIKSQAAGVSSNVANVAALKVQRDDAYSLLQRQKELQASGIVTQRDLDSAQTAYSAAAARYNQAVAQLDSAKVGEAEAAGAGLAQARAQVKQSQAQVKQTEAAVQLAKVNLDHTTIASPIDGVVVSRDVDVGQTVAASLSAPTLFTIANDLTRMRVIANIDQADIGVINASNKISFTVDAFAGQIFRGQIQQIRLNSQTVQNVVTYNVVIEVDNPDLKLKPGMTTNLTITVSEKTDVLKIPNAALRFTPQGVTPDQVRELLRAGGAGQPGVGSSQPASPASGQASPTRDGSRRRDQGAPPSSGSQPNQAAGGARGVDAKAGTKPDHAAAGTPSPSPSTEGRPRLVWVLGPDKKPVARRIRAGITDGVFTELLEGDLKEGDLVITAQTITSSQAQASGSTRAPGFGGGGPGGGIGGGGGGPRRN